MKEQRLVGHFLLTMPKLATLLNLIGFLDPIEERVFSTKHNHVIRPLLRLEGNYEFMLGNFDSWRFRMRERHSWIEKKLDVATFDGTMYDQLVSVQAKDNTRSGLVWARRITDTLMCFETVVFDIKDYMYFTDALNNYLDRRVLDTLQQFQMNIPSIMGWELDDNNAYFYKEELNFKGIRHENVSTGRLGHVITDLCNYQDISDDAKNQILSAMGHFMTSNLAATQICHRYYQRKNAGPRPAGSPYLNNVFYYLSVIRVSEDMFWLEYLWLTLEEQIRLEELLFNYVLNF